MLGVAPTRVVFVCRGHEQRTWMRLDFGLSHYVDFFRPWSEVGAFAEGDALGLGMLESICKSDPESFVEDPRVETLEACILDALLLFSFNL